MRTTERICRALKTTDGSAVELAAELGLTLKDTSGALSNLKKQKAIEVVKSLPRARGHASLYRLAKAPVIGRPRK